MDQPENSLHSGVRGAAFVGVSVDGFLARADGDMAWLESLGGGAGDAGYLDFLRSVDGVVLGRGTYDFVGALSTWPFEGLPVWVLSTTLAGDADHRITVCRSLSELPPLLTAAGVSRPLIDGGKTIQSCLRLGLVRELTITTVPILIGGGIPLFGSLATDIRLAHVSTTILAGGLVQTTYRVATLNDQGERRS